MKTKYLNCTYIIIILVFLIGSLINKGNPHKIMPYNSAAIIYSSGSPSGMTGAPGENNCTQCHAGSINDGSSTSLINFSGTNNEYITGTNYNVTLSIQNGSAKNGFQVVVLDSILDLKSGNLIITDPSNTQLFTGTRDYITHKTSGTSLTSWSFDWTSPISYVGPITFYYSYNVTNNAGNSSGDQIYLGSHTILPSCNSLVDDSIINNSPILTANASGAIYQWLDCDNNFAPIVGETSQSYTATSNGNFAVSVTQNNCTDTSICISIYNVGWNNLHSSDIQIHPNPTTDQITIQIDDFNEPIESKLFDLRSNLLGTYKTKNISLKKYAKGIYLLKINYAGIVKEVKVIRN